MTDALDTAPEVTMTENAANRIRALIDGAGNPELRFRLSVNGGGCSGFSYSFDLDDSLEDEDLVFPFHGVEMVVDQVSLDFVKGSEIDFVEDLIGSAFRVNNPNATSSCGCGSSFSV